MRLIKIAIGALGLASAIQAQELRVDWFSLASSAVVSTGGEYSLNGSVGQVASRAVPLAGGDFSLTGGFWSGFSIMTIGLPILTIEWQGTEIRMSWPAASKDFVLEESREVTGPWTSTTTPPATNGGEQSVTVPATEASHFFRLKKP